MEKQKIYVITATDGKHKRRVYYLPEIGRKRWYRQDVSIVPKKLKLLSFKLKRNAQKVCDEINSHYKDNFKVTSIKSLLTSPQGE